MVSLPNAGMLSYGTSQVSVLTCNAVRGCLWTSRLALLCGRSASETETRQIHQIMHRGQEHHVRMPKAC